MRIRAGLTGQEARDILTFLQKSNDPAKNQEDSK
jgi:cytochrome c1